MMATNSASGNPGRAAIMAGVRSVGVLALTRPAAPTEAHCNGTAQGTRELSGLERRPGRRETGSHKPRNRTKP